jgi:hypothetical protein
MSDVKLISRKKLQADAKSLIESGKGPMLDLVDFSRPILSGKWAGMSHSDRFDKIDKMRNSDLIDTNMSDRFRFTAKYGGGFDVPMKWGDDTEMSVRERIKSGKFNPTKMSTNTLPVDWVNLWDALRIDVSVRKAARGTIRENIYNVTRNPNFTRQVNPTEISPFGIVFEENNGHGQAVPQGETRGGSYDTFS